MFGKYSGLVNKARVSACMYFLVIRNNVVLIGIVTPIDEPCLSVLLYCIKVYCLKGNGNIFFYFLI